MSMREKVGPKHFYATSGARPYDWKLRHVDLNPYKQGAEPKASKLIRILYVTVRCYIASQ